LYAAVASIARRVGPLDGLAVLPGKD